MQMPRLICKFNAPQIMWYQNDNHVVIKIILIDVTDYHLDVRPDHFQFSTSLNNKDYNLCFQLFGSVHPEETTHMNLGREIKVYLSKAHKFFDWLRLTYHNERYTYISHDPEYIVRTDCTDLIQSSGKECFSDYKLRNKIDNLMPVVPSSDEEESDDERSHLNACD